MGTISISRRVFGFLGRVNSITTPVGGVSWTPPPSEREELRKLVVFLEDRRALFDPYNVEATVLVEHSVQQIRAELTTVLQTIGENARAGESLRTMRAACQVYLTRAPGFRNQYPWDRPHRSYSGSDGGDSVNFILALGELRGVFGACLSQIASMYGMKVHGELAGLVAGRSADA